MDLAVSCIFPDQVSASSYLSVSANMRQVTVYSGLQNDRRVFLEIVHRAEIEPHSAICTAFFLSHEKYFSNPKQEFTK